MNVQFHCRMFWAVLCLGLSAQAAEQATDAAAESGAVAAESLPVTQLPAIRVEAHYENGVGTSDASSAGVVNGQVFEDAPLLRPGEALETVPGLVVTQHSGDGKANQYFLRGYNLDHGTDFATSVDGVPVNLPTNAHGQGYSDLNFMIPELIDTIDYRKGPYFAANGDFSSAGSADVHYKNRLDRSFFQYTPGSFNYQRALFAGSRAVDGDAAGGDAPVALGAVEILGEDGPWTVPENLRKLNGLVRISDGNKASGWSVDGNLYDAHWNSTDQVPLSMVQSGQLGLYSPLDPTDGGDSGRVGVSAEWHRADSSGFSRASVYAQHYHLQLWSDFTYYGYRNPLVGCNQIAANLGITFNLPNFPGHGCPLAPNANSPTDQFSQFESRNFFGTQVARGYSHTLLGRDSVTEAGVQLRHDDINVGLQDTQARVAFYTVSSSNVSETEGGIYIQNTTVWTPWLRTLAGLREDRIAMDTTSYVQTVNSGSASGSQFSPKLSVIFGPWHKTEYFFNIGRGFHSNDARGAVATLNPSTGQAVSPVSPLVGSLGKEVGLRSEAVPGLQTSLALWSLHSDSELVYSADAGSTDPNGASDRYGLEWNNHLIPQPWLLLDADLAWTHARYATMNDNGQNGDMIPNAVSKVAVLRGTVQDVKRWSAGVETRYIGPYPLSQDGSLMAPSAIVTNMRAGHRVASDADLSLDVLNLFNRQYFDIAYQQDYQATAGGAYVPSGMTVHPGEPREFRLSLHVKF